MPTASEVLAGTEKHEAKLEKAETRILRKVMKQIGEVEDRLITTLMNQWLLDFGDLDVEPEEMARFDLKVKVISRSFLEEIAAIIEAAKQEAFEAGVKLADVDVNPERLKARLSEVFDTSPDLSPFPIGRGTFQVVAFAVNRLMRSAGKRAEANVSFVANKAATEAVSEHAHQNGMLKMWVAERDGCVHCLAYAGDTTDSSFQEGKSFDTQGLKSFGNLTGPPLHPNCKCRIEPLDPADDSGIQEALKREAERSVLRGTAPETESTAARVRAADNLLRQGTDLPKSVQRVAERAVRDGSF